MLLKCIRKEGKQLGGERFENNSQKKKLRNYLNDQLQTLRVSSEIAVIIWDYTGVTGHPCALFYGSGACLPRYADQR